ncbi:putative type VI secretion system effector [Massilia sp. S19_KUP03_FR1]|uniref:putative type VI secretion system effector n=1 Tax=Massilia sp. S19_KUP03_FR1 TaxID=3025503 RepID=UPI002FCDA653
MEVVAVLASIAGLGGQAMATSANAHSLEEAADYVEFDIAEKNIKGWLWRSPFVDFDNVEIAVEWQGDHYEVFRVCRPADRTIALYPHCSRARTRHVKNAIRWWLLMLIFFYLSVFVIYYSDTYDLHKTIQYFQSLFEEGWDWTFFGGIFAAITVPTIQ